MNRRAFIAGLGSAAAWPVVGHYSTILLACANTLGGIVSPSALA